MVLAAGRGERMRPLTDTLPKPLLCVRGKPLMQWHLESLAAGGFDRVVVNTAWLGEAVERRFGDTPLWGPGKQDTQPLHSHLRYSHEGHDFGAALETAGGIARALPLLDEVFWVVAGDVFVPGFQFTRQACQRFAASGALAHLWLVPNPAHKPQGDFGISSQGRALSQARQTYTFSTIALYRRAFFDPSLCGIAAGNPDGIKAPLAPLLRAAMDNQQVSAELYVGAWADVGTPQRLAALNQDRDHEH